ncbi:Zinc-finger domain of monoamine-oxidase A repressor R [Trema orientale]|uniref:Zinc-finger domain of monoamine-oxidase A repressor R n=1 Tax=Trema orientale TaxID=63057 RepID=A0A2P5BW91_TREOI|nr:Zinc-finger domain of monoamine-oxidase A repressor R [Trema orientale]
MAGRKKRARETNGDQISAAAHESQPCGTSDAPGYEQSRDLRIKENKERMEKLGIPDLSLKLKSHSAPKKRFSRDPYEKKAQTLPRPDGSPRRSSRIKTLAPVSYVELRPKGTRGSSESNEIRIKEGLKPEIYTEEHEKLLGDCKKSWTLLVDGYGEDGKRIYDEVNGETCHQCRQKTLGQHTRCSKCNLVQGQFCGDCLYSRYGENVIEAKENPNWVCPVCRDVCNCSLCRKEKGWMPTGPISRKVFRLGYKSVAHYLIQTHRSQKKAENLSPEDDSHDTAEGPEEFSTSQPDDLMPDDSEEEVEKVQLLDNKRVGHNSEDEKDAGDAIDHDGMLKEKNEVMDEHRDFSTHKS